MVGQMLVPSLKVRPMTQLRFGTTTASKPAAETPAESTPTQLPAPTAEVLKSQLLPSAQVKKATEASKEIMPVNVAWSKLPSGLKSLLTPVLNERMIPTLSPLTASPKMGILEEASDIMYECFVLTAIQTNVLKDKLINRAKQYMSENPTGITDLKKSITQVSEWMNEDRSGTHEVIRLANLTGMEPDMAEDLLALTYLRIATLQMEGRLNQPQLKTRDQLKGEFWELMERLPQDVKHTMGSSIVYGGYQNMQNQFPAIMTKLTDVLQKTLGAEASPDIMHEFTRNKHYLRQGIRLAYLNQPDMHYDNRKRTSKAIEALVEVSLLKRIGAL